MLSDFLVGFSAAIIACLFTGLGGFMVFLKKQYKKEDINFMLNVAAGIMLGAAFFSLLAPAVEVVMNVSSNRFVGGVYIIAAISLGAGLLWMLNFLVPHEHNVLEHKGKTISVKTALLFIIAITLHKFPEGLAIGVAYSAKDLVNPQSLTLGIALQNIPEGLTVAIALIANNKSKLKSALIATLVGFVQPIGAIIGLLLMNINVVMLPFGMALAGGTMLFVVINEVLPETYGGEHNKKSSLALFLGFIFMTYVAVVLE